MAKDFSVLLLFGFKGHKKGESFIRLALRGWHVVLCGLVLCGQTSRFVSWCGHLMWYSWIQWDVHGIVHWMPQFKMYLMSYLIHYLCSKVLKPCARVQGLRKKGRVWSANYAVFLFPSKQPPHTIGRRQDSDMAKVTQRAVWPCENWNLGCELWNTGPFPISSVAFVSVQ